MAKLTAQERIAKLEAQRKTISLKIQAVVRKEEEETAKKNSGNRNRIGVLAEECGISDLSDDDLRAAFNAIKKTKTASQTAQPAQSVQSGASAS